MSKFDFLDRYNEVESLNVDRIGMEDFAVQVGGSLVTTEDGTYLEVVCGYNCQYAHGSALLGRLLARRQFNIDHFEVSDGNGTAHLSETVFIDTETTGLATATGTVAFLIGVGLVEQGQFKVHQLFLPDYPDEPALLKAVSELVDQKRFLVSFNGKAFDLPLLETRYVMQRMKNPFTQMRHIDLLHSSRRFFKGKFADTTLQTLEKELLGFYRYDDTPGYLIPQIFFDFLKTGYVEPLEGVLRHNRFDIVTLLCLIDSIETYLENAAAMEYYSPADALTLAHFFYRKRNLDLSREVAERQFHGDIRESARIRLGFHLGWMQKRLGRYDDALKTFFTLRECRGEMKISALESAAKILEHQKRDLNRASEVTMQALEYLDNPLAEIPRQRVSFWNETLQKRRRRLLRKLNK